MPNGPPHDNDTDDNARPPEESGAHRYGRRAYDDPNAARQGDAPQSSSPDEKGDGKDADDEDSEGKSESKSDKKKEIFHSPAFRIGAVVVVLVLIVAGVVWWLIARQYEKTDDAFIDAHIVHIAPRIAGQITAVTVNDNQLVHRGESIAEIDSADAQTRLDQTRAQVQQADTQYQQTQAALQAVQSQLDNAERDLARYRNLQRTTPEAVAAQQVDQAATAERNLKGQRDAAAAQVNGALAQRKVYESQVAAAELNLGYTHIVAPVDGHVAQRTVAAGNYVAPGQALLDIVPLDVWVTANFKETQLKRMRVGQEVSVGIDACRAKVPGHVDSIQRGAGQAFSLLPPENATGNFVKVVQRVPVKITLDRMPDNCLLGPGMSVQPRVTVR